MIKGLKKVAAISAAVITLFTGSILTGCDISLKEYEYEDFKYVLTYYMKDTEEGGAEKVWIVHLRGLTEEGKKKEAIVVPSEIKGYPVISLSVGGSMWSDETSYDVGFLESENLKAIYLPEGIEVTAVKTFAACPNLEKIIYLAPLGFFKAKLNENQKRFIRFYESSLNENGTAICDELKYYANISYFYNYEKARNDGFYWIDNFAYGEKIEYIPEEPTRTGYTFGGWYKEESCENAWNFETDTLPAAKYNENGDELYQETKLYAKWIKE